LAAYPDTNIILCDDGLQHLALARDIEICVFNEDGIGNGWLLPAGPLRESWPRSVDCVLHAGATLRHSVAPQFVVTRTLGIEAVDSHGTRVPLLALRTQRLYAVAAIARPAAFFAMLRAQGLQPEQEEALPDHYDFAHWQRPPDPEQKVICTEKDAVKLWPRYPDVLAVPLQVQIAPGFFTMLDRCLHK